MFIYIKSNTDYQYEISIGGFGFEDRATTYACDKDTYDFFEYRKQHWDSTSKQMRNFYEKYNEGVANKDNFFVNTIAEFDLVKYRPKRKPDYVSTNREGKVSSEYWYSSEGVIRGSNHWGTDIASCDWYLKSVPNSKSMYKSYGFAPWEEFTQKPEIMLDKDNMVAFLSNFNNTIGGKKFKHGFCYPIVRGLND